MNANKWFAILTCINILLFSFAINEHLTGWAIVDAFMILFCSLGAVAEFKD